MTKAYVVRWPHQGDRPAPGYEPDSLTQWLERVADGAAVFIGGGEHSPEDLCLGRDLDAFVDELNEVAAERDALRAQVERLTSAVPGLAESGPYTMADVERIEAHRGKPYARLRATVEQVERVRAYCEGRIKTHWRIPDVYITASEALDALEGK